MPDYMLTGRYPTGLEDHFTVVWWERRGSGLSYSSSIPRESITLEQMISDTLALTDYLRRRFGKEKVYLMGHSGGTFVGIQAAARRPDMYHAYIAVAQESNQLKSEMLAREYMLERYRAAGNQKMVRKLEASPVTVTDGTPRSYLAIRDQAMHGLGIGTTRDMKSVITGIFIPSFQFRDYTLGEKIRLWRGKFQTGVSPLWNDELATDLPQQFTEFSLPIYFLHGVYDYTVSYTEAEAYFSKLKAPIKGFYTFENSAHSPIFEEPDKTQRIVLEDVLQGRNGLADAMP
jgi:pimeloyl-ACP methyl ester carboxylesterase